MKKTYFDPEQDGFYGVWYPLPGGSDTAMIVMLGDSSDDTLATLGVRWMMQRGCSVMAMSPAAHDYSHHNYPLERFGAAIRWMRERGVRRIGVAGASTTGMLALLAAAYYEDITLTIAISPSDFVMEGFYRDGLDGAEERPADGQSTVSWQGEPLPYLPFCYRHPTYWRALMLESHGGANLIASRQMFERSERLHPVTDRERIPTEKIRGRLVLIGAEDDCLWNTCRYIRRIQRNLSAKPHTCTCEALTYDHGTHFLFPQSMVTRLLPVGSSLLVSLFFKAGRRYPRACRLAREDVDQRLTETILHWREEN